MGTGVGEAMLMSAATGAATSGGVAALTGGDPLQAALTGGLLGGAGVGIGGAMGGQAAGAALPQAGAQAMGAASPQAMQGAMQGMQGMGAEALTGGVGDIMAGGMPVGEGMTSQFIGQDLGAAAPNIMPQEMYNPEVGLWDVFSPGDNPALEGMGLGDRAANYLVQNPVSVGMGASTLSGMMDGPEKKEKGEGKYKGPLSKFSYDPDEFMPSFAEGGLAATPEASMFGAGRLLEGAGDGMSDSIPAHIEGIQPAALSDGEFVIPADVVSGLGNGSTDAGAKALYDLMDRVRHSRTGTTAQGAQIDPEEHLQYV